MNWPIRTVVLFFFSLFTFFSCNNPDVELDVPGETKLGTTFTDTITVKAATVLLNDSILSRGRGNFLVGRISNPTTGTVTATAFTEVGMSATTFTDAATATVDSMVFSLDYDEYYGDTTQQMTVRVHRMQEPIRDDQVYYTSTTAAYQATPVGALTFKPQPTGPYVVLPGASSRSRKPIPARIRLNNSLAQEILAQSGKTALSSQNEFIKFLPGFAITADNNAQAILGFKLGTAASDSTYIRIYYKSGGVKRFYTLYPTVSNNRFNQIRTDFSGTPLARLQTSGDSVPATSTNNRVFVQESTGLKAKIRFPYIRQFRNRIGKDFILNRAELIVPVVSGSGTNVPPYLYLYETNKSNKILKARTGNAAVPRAVSRDGAVYPSGYSGPASLFYSAKDQAYTLNVTSYVQALMYDIRPRESANPGARELPLSNGLIISPSSFAFGTGAGVNDLLALGSLRQAMLSMAPGSQIRLRLYYSIANQ